MTTHLDDLERIEDDLTQIQQQLTTAATTLDALHTIQVQFADLVVTYEQLQRTLSTIEHDWQTRENHAQVALKRLGDAEETTKKLVGALESSMQTQVAEFTRQIRQLVGSVQQQQQTLQQQQQALFQQIDTALQTITGSVQQQQETLQQQQETLAHALREDMEAQFHHQRSTVDTALRTVDERVCQQQETLQQQETRVQSLQEDMEAQFQHQRSTVDTALCAASDHAASLMHVLQDQLTALEILQQQKSQETLDREQQIQQQVTSLDTAQRSDRELLVRTLETLYQKISEQHTQTVTGLRQDFMSTIQQRGVQTEQLLTTLEGRSLARHEILEQGMNQHVTNAGQQFHALEQRAIHGEAVLQRNRQMVTVLLIIVLVLVMLFVGLSMWVLFNAPR